MSWQGGCTARCCQLPRVVWPCSGCRLQWALLTAQEQLIEVQPFSKHGVLVCEIVWYARQCPNTAWQQHARSSSRMLYIWHSR